MVVVRWSRGMDGISRGRDGRRHCGHLPDQRHQGRPRLEGSLGEIRRARRLPVSEWAAGVIQMSYKVINEMSPVRGLKCIRRAVCPSNGLSIHGMRNGKKG